jgi:hypothetical protein
MGRAWLRATGPGELTFHYTNQQQVISPAATERARVESMLELTVAELGVEIRRPCARQLELDPTDHNVYFDRIVGPDLGLDRDSSGARLSREARGGGVPRPGRQRSRRRCPSGSHDAPRLCQPGH